jgi:dUTP pyrophosphatase
MNVNIRKLHADAVIPQYATEGSSGFDLHAVEDVIIAPGDTELIPLGLAFEIPQGYEMQIRPRSGITLNTKLRIANSPATIDADFRGEIAVIVDNTAMGDNFIDYTYGLVNGKYLTDSAEGHEVEYDAEYEDVNVYYLIRKHDRIAQGVLQRVERGNFVECAELTETVRGSGGFGSTGVCVK